ncbi:uncharacterized protein NPIL_587891 [Nephila pilipes]|uniref:RRM domain-containing protein n=1 Tax=Nephila pilipes TaxID=299642 RepID=A0A8X6QL90_NEPPI|nr:uncharacterized protein NPIL_587891 [Nephila pilipes]
MMFGDSLEVDVNNGASTSADPLPLNPDINRSKIWIPAQVLPNRQETMNLNKNVPTALQTLKQPEVKDRFSVYSDGESDSDPLPPAYLEFQRFLMKNGPSIRESLKNRKSDTIPENCEMKMLNFDKMLKVMNDAEASGVTGMINLGTISDYHEDEHSEKVEISEISEDQLKSEECLDEHDNSSVSVTDSLNEIYISDEEQNKSLFDVEVKKSNEPLHCETVAFDSNCLKGNKYSNGETLNKSHVQVKEHPTENPKIVFDELKNKAISKEIVVTDNKSEQKSLCGEKDEALNALAQKIEEYTIAYQRPTLEKQISKSKTSKEKKMKKKGKRILPITSLFQDDDKSRFEKPEVDEFYQNLICRGICKPAEQLANMTEFPFEQTNLFPCTVEERMTEANCTVEERMTEANCTVEERMTETNCTQNLKIDSKPNFTNEMDVDKTEGIKSEIWKRGSTETIVIENIPKDVTREDIENIVLRYGELKKLSIEPHGKFLRAKLKMDFICDSDWIIDCLDGNQPFGVFEEKLKCYKLTE